MLKNAVLVMMLGCGSLINASGYAQSAPMPAPYTIPLTYSKSTRAYYVPISLITQTSSYSEATTTTYVALDTGSSILQLPGGSNYCDNCTLAHSTVSPIYFNSFNVTPVLSSQGSFAYGYGSGLSFTINVYQSSLQVGLNTAPTGQQLTINDHTFGVISNVTTEGASGVEFPLLGLAPSVPTDKSVTPAFGFMHNLLAQGSITQDTFGLLLCTDSGTSNFYVGGINPALVDAQPVATIPFNNEGIYTLTTPVSLSLVYGNNAPQLIDSFSDVPAEFHNYVLDSGSPWLLLTTSIFNELSAALQQQFPSINPDFFNGDGQSAQLTAAQIAALPTLQISFANNMTLNVPPKYYLQNTTGNNYIFLVKSHPNVNFGVPLLENYYVQYDWQDHQAVFYSNQGLCVAPNH